jgi:von Willebrand factor type A domain
MSRCRALLPIFLGLSVSLSGQSVGDCNAQVLANAIGADGIPVTGLSTKEFRASSKGHVLTIKSAQFTESISSRAVVLLDSSGSMSADGDSNKWRIALAAASEFVSSAPPSWQISLMTFADHVKEKFEAADGRKPIEGWLRSAAASRPAELKGHTALYETVMEALKELHPSRPGDAIYVITDGGENYSAETMSHLDHDLRAANTRLFAFLFDDYVVLPVQDFHPRELEDLTHNSGGFIISLTPHARGPKFPRLYDYDDRTERSIRESARIIGEQIGNYYVLGVQPQVAASKPEDWKLEVVDTQGHARKDVTVAYPHKLAGCPTQTAPR